LGRLRPYKIPSLTGLHAAKSLVAFRNHAFGFELIEANIVVRRFETAPTANNARKWPGIPEASSPNDSRKWLRLARARDDHRDMAADRSHESLIKIARAEFHVEMKVIVVVRKTNQPHAELCRVLPKARLDASGVILRAKREASLGERAF
jgi:hypothetical protein